MVFIHYLLVALFLFVAKVQSDGMVGVDFAGGDLSQVSALSSTVCAQQCDNVASCQGWSWDSCGKVNCYLKSTIGTRSANSCRVSDVKQGEKGVDRQGYDLPGSPFDLGTGSTASTCAYKCVNTTGCVAWSFAGSCYLKWWAAAPTASSATTYSGVQGTYGLDFPNVGDLTTVALPSNSSSTTCSRVCENNVNCYAWSFGISSSSCPALAPTCWLKTFTPGQTTNTGYACRTAGFASRFYNTTIPRTAVNVTSITLVGNQTDSHQAPVYPGRDGGVVGSVGGKIVWAWSDTTYVNINNGAFAGFYGNTGAIGNPSNPLIMNGTRTQAIPFTSQEIAFNNMYSNNPRVVLWPKSGPVETTPGKGLIWVPKGYYGKAINESEPNKGIVLASVVIGSNGYASYTRFSDEPLFPLHSVPSYGSVAATKDQNYIYLYSMDSIATYTSTHHIARVPIDSATDLASYEYYNKASKTWGPTAPAINNTAAAIFTSTFGIDGNVYYSSYHRAWVLIFSFHADYKVYMRTAPAPEGPWTTAVLIYSPPPSPTVNYVYGTTGTGLYDTTGKTSSIDFTWCYHGGYANWVVQVNFA